MKQMRATFDDEEFNALGKAKGKTSWHDFIMKLAEKKQK